MNAAETIQAAIDRLSALSGEGTPAPWGIFEPDPTAIYRTFELFGEYEEHVADTVTREDRDLIVALHRTINVQLAILRDDYETCVKNDWVPDRRVLALARAILGGDL